MTRSDNGADAQRYEHVAVLVPCYNEEVTVGKVVREFAAALPGATVYVYDNNSTDRTAEIAGEAGAQVVLSPRQGKGNVVQHMFEEIDADLYVMIDGDDTYDAAAAPQLIDKIKATHADMLVGTRLSVFSQGSFRQFHQYGNRLISRLISVLFRIKVTDVLSGYRVFTREFVKTVPLMSEGFEIETELTLQAAAKGYRIVEHPTKYGVRPEGSESKLSTYVDGFLIIRAIVKIFKDYKPNVFFGVVALILAMLSLLAGSVPVIEYYQTQYVSHVPLAVLAASIGILAALSAAVGLVLSTVNRYHDETFKLWRKALKAGAKPKRD